MNNILCFDVSNRNCSVAVSSGQRVLAFEQEFTPSKQSERLLLMIELVLKKAKLKYSDLDYLAVTVGPGSFTGIRIGLAAAKGIIYASGIQAIGISNFETAFYRLKMQVKDFDRAIIMLNAYRDQIYIQEFAQDGKSDKPSIIDFDDIKNHLMKKKGRIICTGSGLAEIYHLVKDIDHITFLPRFPTIRAIHIARYADEKINSGKRGEIEPLYIPDVWM